jgi:hypothetical protein
VRPSIQDLHLQRYDYDLDRGTLTFSHEGVPRVVASVLVAGTTSESGGTWLWGWANAYIPVRVSAPLKKVRDFGIAEGIAELSEEYVPDDEHVGWAMTALASRIMGAKGAYRCPGDYGFLYLIFADIAFADIGPQEHGRRMIACSAHGQAGETFVCEHLIAKPGQRWFSDEPTPENPWPDAWCTACNSFFEEQGEWNKKNEAHLKIKLLCHLCYEQFRARSEHDR